MTPSLGYPASQRYLDETPVTSINHVQRSGIYTYDHSSMKSASDEILEATCPLASSHTLVDA